MIQSLIGTSLHNIGTLPVDISLKPRAIRKQEEFNARKPYLFASAAALICCMLISMICVNKVSAYEKERSEKVKANIEKAQREVSRIQKVNGEMLAVKNRYNTTLGFFKERRKYTDMLNEIQSFMPDQMWLVSLEPKLSERRRNDDENGRNADVLLVHHTPESINEAREIKELVLTGYALNLDENFDPVSHFRENVRRESKFFKPDVEWEPKQAGQSNLSSFKITLTLKEKIKK